MIYVDPLMGCIPNKNWRWEQSCHLTADTEEELHRFAELVGLRAAWFQKKPGHIPHYDLTPSKRKLAVNLGAVEIDRHQAGVHIRRFREAEKLRK